MSTFSKKAVQGSNDVYPQEDATTGKKEFNRDESDNYLFKEIQVEDISALIRPETVFYDDSDMMVYRAASMVEEKRVKITHKEDNTITFDCKNVTEFKGRGKKVGDNSVLGLYNVDLELQGKTLLTPDDFEIQPYQLIQSRDEEKAFESAKIQILKTLKETRLQYQIHKIIPVLGEGACFREFGDQCRLYKGNRVESLRPLLLKRLRQWMVDEVGAINVKDKKHFGKTIECDDWIEIVAAQGVAHYRKHGWYHIGVISKDKDSVNSAKLLINNDRVMGKGKDGGKLKFPKAMHIQATDRCTGDVVLLSKGEGKSKDFKGFGFKFLMYQCFLGIDSSDNYSALKHLERGFDFGDVSAYKVLKPCKTAKETLQETINVFAELLPDGVQYRTHDGRELYVDTLTYMNTYFLTAYMIRKLDDNMDFYKLCEAFKVDVSKIKDNHIEKVLPLADEPTLRSVITELRTQLAEITDSAVPVKAETKPLQIERLNKTVDMLKEYDNMFDKLFTEVE